MKIIGSKSDSISREIEWVYAGDNTLKAKKVRKLGKNPIVNLKLEETDTIVKYVKENCYYEICDIKSTLKLPLKVNTTITSSEFLGKENFVIIKTTTIDDFSYRIEIYDPIKSTTLEFGSPIYVCNITPDMLLMFDEESCLSDNHKDINNIILAVKYIIARHYDMAINKILTIKAFNHGEFCLNSKSDNIKDIINQEVINIDFDIKKLLLDFLDRAKTNRINTPRKNVGIFGSFDIGLSPIQGDFLLLRLDNKVNSQSILFGKMASDLRKNSPMRLFCNINSFKEE